ncbi:MAG: hypothetical protein JO368_05930 [Acidimicrobiales bacterium]|nr:hypothetical protein [Acidimicrobiales bacterium]
MSEGPNRSGAPTAPPPPPTAPARLSEVVDGDEVRELVRRSEQEIDRLKQELRAAERDADAAERRLVRHPRASRLAELPTALTVTREVPSVRKDAEGAAGGGRTVVDRRTPWTAAEESEEAPRRSRRGRRKKRRGANGSTPSTPPAGDGRGGAHSRRRTSRRHQAQPSPTAAASDSTGAAASGTRSRSDRRSGRKSRSRGRPAEARSRGFWWLGAAGLALVAGASLVLALT